MYKDTSSDITVTHLKLKTSALEHEDFYKRLTKSEIIIFLKAYGVDATMKSKKQELGEALHEVLTSDECIKINRPEVIKKGHGLRENEKNEAAPSTSGVVTRRSKPPLQNRENMDAVLNTPTNNVPAATSTTTTTKIITTTVTKKTKMPKKIK